MRLSLSFLTTALPQAQICVKQGAHTTVAHNELSWLHKDADVAVSFDSRDLPVDCLLYHNKQHR